MENKNILISGAGVGGLTLGYFLQAYGFKPVIIEKFPSLRHNGYMIDFFSSGIFVAEQMGIIDELRSRDHKSNIIRQFTEKGNPNLLLDLSAFRNSVEGKLFNFLRTDLVEALYNRVKDNVEIRFGASIKSVTQNEKQVQVDFEDGTTEGFDLVVGEDGIHSNVRKLIYTGDEVEKPFLGYYVAGIQHSIPMNIQKGEVLSMICPNRQIMAYPASNELNATLFVFKSTHLEKISQREQKTILEREFCEFAEPVPKILENIQPETHLYFDEVSQIRIRGPWSKKRIVLSGDAAYCITLLSGQGASMAMTGAFILSENLAKFNGDYERAYAAYEANLRPIIEKMQNKAIRNAKTYLPDTKFKLWLRNFLAPIFFTKLFSPLLIKQLGAQNYFDARRRTQA